MIFDKVKDRHGRATHKMIANLFAGRIQQAVALGLGSCQVAALYDEEVNSLLGVDGKEESIIYMTAVGRT